MNDDELKKLWQQQPLNLPDFSTSQLMSVLQKQTSQLRRVLDARDIRELVACVFVMIVFAGYAVFLHAQQPIARLGDFVIIASMVFIAWKLIRTRQTNPPASPCATVVETLRAELNSVRAQSRLLGSVLWWYLLPSFVGALLMTWGGLPIHEPAGMLMMIPLNLLMTLIFMVMGIFIYVLNQRARATQLLPLEAQLESLLRAAETGESPDETLTDVVWPAACSLEPADEVQPVEFNMINCHFSLRGGIGFVGNWSFLMDALTTVKTVPKSAVPDAELFLPSTDGDETNRYPAVAQKIVDLLNAHDFAGVQELFNATMADFLPLPMTTVFFTDVMDHMGLIEKLDGPIGKGFQNWIAFRLQCQRGALKMSLALDVGDKIAGIHFRALFWDSMTFRSFIPRLFNFMHLAFVTPSRQIRLSSSRALQDATERAVGISELGIHLHHGQKLIRWDEIKEIQSRRILGTWSLWLINEAGARTVMPWTSLERHPELKAAVAELAPAEHLLHGYLSLLTH